MTDPKPMAFDRLRYGLLTVVIYSTWIASKVPEFSLWWWVTFVVAIPSVTYLSFVPKDAPRATKGGEP